MKLNPHLLWLMLMLVKIWAHTTGQDYFVVWSEWLQQLSDMGFAL